jgi:hypothetical protein
VARPAVPPAVVDAELGVEATTGAEMDGESNAGADEAGWGWQREQDAPPGTLAHYQMGQP